VIHAYLSASEASFSQWDAIEISLPLSFNQHLRSTHPGHPFVR